MNLKVFFLLSLCIFSFIANAADYRCFGLDGEATQVVAITEKISTIGNFEGRKVQARLDHDVLEVIVHAEDSKKVNRPRFYFVSPLNRIVFKNIIESKAASKILSCIALDFE